MKKISVITGVRNEAETVADVYSEIKRVFARLEDKYEYEHIFMDNCSTDETVTILKEIAEKDKRVKILVFSKNFGVMRSLIIGYKYASGDAVICYEANLKDPPGLILTFIEYWEKGYDVVYGVRNKSLENFLIASLRRLFYKVINALSEDKPPLNAGGFRLADRKIVNELVKIEDYRPFISGLMASIGFKQIGIEYVRGTRHKGRSKSTFGFLLDYLINGIISGSIIPVRLCTVMGIGLSVLSFITGIFYLILKLTIWKTIMSVVAGFVILMTLFLGIQLFFLGIVGEYVAAIHSQVRKKPYIIIKEKINFNESP